MMLRDRRSMIVLMTGALALVCTTGLGAGWLLQRYDRNQGFRREADRIAEVLALRPGMTAGDIRAGLGAWTVDMARRVAPDGEVFATSGPHPAHNLLETVAASGLDNITVITRTPGESPRLPLDCCDAVLMRFVYSDLRIERPALLSALNRIVRPDGRLAVIEANPVGPVGPGRQTLARAAVIDELTHNGFELVADFEHWFGNTYCVVFKRARAGQSARR
jgi:ubiquinone/menaquinone biosynthesis C-methylase UbiE